MLLKSDKLKSFFSFVSHNAKKKSVELVTLSIFGYQLILKKLKEFHDQYFLVSIVHVVNHHYYFKLSWGLGAHNNCFKSKANLILLIKFCMV